MAALACKQRGDFSSIQNCAAANSESNPSANKKAAENRGQQFVGSDIGKFDKGETERQAGNGQSASDRERLPNLAIGECDKRKIDNWNENGELPPEHIRIPVINLPFIALAY